MAFENISDKRSSALRCICAKISNFLSTIVRGF